MKDSTRIHIKYVAGVAIVMIIAAALSSFTDNMSIGDLIACILLGWVFRGEANEAIDRLKNRNG